MKNENHWWQLLFTSESHCKKSERESKFPRESHYLPEDNHWGSLFLLRDKYWGVTNLLVHNDFGVIFWKSQNLQVTSVTCLIFVLSSTIMIWCYPMKFSNKMQTLSLPTWWGGLGAWYTDCGAFQDVQEYKNRIEYKVLK